MEEVRGDLVFASPAKRQKVCADPGLDAGFNSSKAVASRLKGVLKGSSSSMTTTPQKLRQQAQRGGEALPHTPDGKQLSAARGGASADDGLLGLSPQLLAPNLMVLNQILGALYVTLPMVRSRGKAATYQNMRAPVQNFCGRDFQVVHVQQIKALCPEALGWEHIMAFNPATKRQEQQLVLAMPKPPADTAALQQEFFQRLQQRQAAAGAKVAELELPLAALPPAAGPNARDCTPTRQRGASGLLPSTPQTAPPAGNVAQLLLSPPPKRLATASRVSAASAADSGLMSPPPARTRGSARARLAAAPGGDGAAAAGGGFSFSPAPRQPDLLSPRGCSSMGSFGTPAKSVHEPAAAAAAANVEAGSHTPALRPNRLFADSTPIATATPQQPSAARPNTHSTPEAAGEGGSRAAAAGAGGVKVRKLTFDAAAPSAAIRASRAAKAAAAAAASASASGKSEGSTATAAVEAPKTKSGITFELGASAMALLQQVSSAEVKQEAADEREALDKQRVLDMLPSSFEALRAVFGERGPCVKPRTEVVELLRQKSTCKGGMSRADAAEQVDLMQSLVPEFVRTVTASGASLAAVTQSVRVNRQMGWPAARHKLMAAAAEARTGGCAAAAAAVELEEQGQRERQAAAAAAAEAEAAAGECGDEVSDSEEELVIEGRPAVDELGLDILAQLDGGSGKKKGCGDGDILGLLGGGSSAGSSKAAAMPAAVLGALSFKAPAPRRAAAAAKKA